MRGISCLADKILDSAERLGYWKSVKIQINHYERHAQGKGKSETHTAY
jgi:hypothetical protein